MTLLDPAEIKSKIVSIFGDIAPEIDSTTIDYHGDICNEFGISTIDFYRLIAEVNEVFDIEIPESDYGKITSLNRLVNYVAKGV